MRAEAADGLPTNRVLNSLTRETRDRVVKRLEHVQLTRDQPLLLPGLAPQFAYFPVRGLISMVADLPEGLTVEVATIGPEGMLGLDSHLGAEASPFRAMVQVEGEGLRLRAADVHPLQEAEPELSKALDRYAYWRFIATAQLAACNRGHGVEQRLPRWLLLCRAAAGADEFGITQEYIAQMLGVQRPTVTLGAINLQTQGAISYQRGRVQILDVTKLTAAACKCQSLIDVELNRLLPLR